MNIRYFRFFALCLLSTILISASPRQITESQEETEVAGNWSGTSVCQLKNSGCHDESAYYRISKTKNPLIYQVEGYKIVNKDTLNMGILEFN